MICKKALARTRASVSQIVFLCAIFQKHVLLYTQEQQFFSRKKNLRIFRPKIDDLEFFEKSYLFTVKPYCGCRINILIKLQSVQYSGFARRIQA